MKQTFISRSKRTSTKIHLIIERDTAEAKAAAKILAKRFRKHFKAKRAKYWDKVAKRYITAFSRLGSAKLVGATP